MSDRLHTHTEHGYVRGCPACEQVRRDHRRSLATYALTNKAEERALVAAGVPEEDS